MLRRIFLIAIAAAVCCAALWWTRLRVQRLDAQRLPSGLPVSAVRDGSLTVSYPNAALLREIATYNDEFFAFLMFQHFARATPLREAESLLTYENTANGGVYKILVRLPGDLVSAANLMARLYAAGLVDRMEWEIVDEPQATRAARQTRVFLAAYSLPAQRTLETLPRSTLTMYLNRFIRYKSATDPRIRKRIEPVPSPLAAGDAHRLAAGIITVAEFYSLPLDLFLGIAAMENNYMNVPGDLTNTAWKRRAAKDDIVVERRRGRVRVSNRAEGVWQITRETLRYAHRLYLKDTRDYSRLPDYLRPRERLDLSTIDSRVLTTYAGLIFRDLLDRFDGEAALAVGAYNGGPGRPNAEYESGVRTVAQYARRMVEQAAALNGESAVEKQWLTP
jgi:hypothetical protein